jgi:hypothetical protein
MHIFEIFEVHNKKEKIIEIVHKKFELQPALVSPVGAAMRPHPEVAGCLRKSQFLM